MVTLQSLRSKPAIGGTHVLPSCLTLTGRLDNRRERLEMKPSAYIAVCCTSHGRLLEGLAPLSDADFREAGLLPYFTRGHVVTHLANKVRAHARLFGGPAAGEVRRLHPAGYDGKAAADLGAGRSATELRADLESSLEILEAAWHALDDVMWNELGEMTAGPRTMSEIIGHHLRNVEVHHVDLDIGYGVNDWPPLFVEGELAKRLQALPGRADHAELLAWLLDRAQAPEQQPW
jgi:maleylpyruvate isomerase